MRPADRGTSDALEGHRCWPMNLQEPDCSCSTIANYLPRSSAIGQGKDDLSTAFPFSSLHPSHPRCGEICLGRLRMSRSSRPLLFINAV